MSLTSKQVRYLWAIGYFKSGGAKGKVVVNKSATGRVAAAVKAPAPKVKKAVAVAAKSATAQYKQRTPEQATQHLLSIIQSTEASHAQRTADFDSMLAKHESRQAKVQMWKASFKGVPDPEYARTIRANKLHSKIQIEIKALKAVAEGRAQMVLGEVTKQQGFDKLPTLVTEEQHAALVAAGHTAIYRGVKSVGSGEKVTAEKIHEDFRSGPLFMASGIYGMGTYFSPQRDTAQQYAWRGNHGGVLTASIKPTARVIMHSELLKLYQAAVAKHPKLAVADESAFAASMGYDLTRSDSYQMYVPNIHHRVLLNRGAISVVKYTPPEPGWAPDWSNR